MYIELFLLDNALYNYLMLRLASVICSRRIKPWRMTLFALAGAVYAAIAILVPLLMSLPFKLLSGMLFALALPFNNVKSYFGGVMSIFLAAFVTGGLSIAITLIFGGNMSNGMIIASVPLRIALLAFSFCCFLPKLMRNMLARRNSGSIALTLVHDKKRYRLSGFIDSGNMLCEPISSLPVILLYLPSLETKANIPVPILTANGESIIFAFRPDSLKLGDIELDALLAISKTPIAGADALIPSSLIPIGKDAENADKELYL